MGIPLESTQENSSAKIANSNISIYDLPIDRHWFQRGYSVISRIFRLFICIHNYCV